MTRRIVPVDERQRYPAKPNAKYPPAPDVGKEARDWYEGVARMPHTVSWRSPEWLTLRRMARVVDFVNSAKEPRASLLTEIRRFEQRAGVTAADRAALGVVWDE